MDTVKTSFLESMVKQINKIKGAPAQQYSGKGAELQANVGHHFLDQAYGGSRLCKVVNAAGACEDVLGSGYVTKSTLYALMKVYLRGVTA